MDRLNKNLSGIPISDELHSKVGTGFLHLNHDTFNADVTIRTAPNGQGTLLLQDIDYMLENQHDRLTTEAGRVIYTALRITNPAYQNTDLYFTYVTVGDFAEAADINEINTALTTFLPRSGGALTGPLILSGAPTEDQEAVTKKYVDDRSSGWIPSSDWNYEGATSFSIYGDHMDIFRLGLKIKLTQSTTKYFYVKYSEYFDDYTFVYLVSTTLNTLTSGPIVNPAISFAEAPPGFPGMFPYSCNVTGFSNMSTLISYYSIHNKTVVWDVPGFTATSNATTFTLTLPDVGITFNTDELVCIADNGTRGVGMVYTSGSSSTIATVYKGYHGAFTASGTKGIYACRLVYFFQ